MLTGSSGGVQSDIRKVETHVSYVDAGFTQAYWDSYGFDLVTLNRRVFLGSGCNSRVAAWLRGWGQTGSCRSWLTG